MGRAWQFIKSKRVATASIAIIFLVLAIFFALFGSVIFSSSSAPPRERGPGRSEFRSGIIEHTAIVSAILRCHGIDDVNAIPEQQLPTLHILGNEPVSHQNYAPIKFSGTDIAIAYMSKEILDQRASISEQVSLSDDARFKWQAWVIGIGAISTILVSLTSTRSDMKGPVIKTIGILAIVFSAIGTASASLATFVGADLAYKNNKQTLEQLRALHSEVAAKFPAEYMKVCDAPATKPGSGDGTNSVNDGISDKTALQNDLQKWSVRLYSILDGDATTQGSGTSDGNAGSNARQTS
jgi:hypothetical protein